MLHKPRLYDTRKSGGKRRESSIQYSLSKLVFKPLWRDTMESAETLPFTPEQWRSISRVLDFIRSHPKREECNSVFVEPNTSGAGKRHSLRATTERATYAKSESSSRLASDNRPSREVAREADRVNQ